MDSNTSTLPDRVTTSRVAGDQSNEGTHSGGKQNVERQAAARKETKRKDKPQDPSQVE